MEVDSLTDQLQQAKQQLRETDESIKRVTGRDVFDIPRGGASNNGNNGAPFPSVTSSLRGNTSTRNAIFTRENAAFARDVERSRPAPGYEESNKRSRGESSACLFDWLVDFSLYRQ